MRERLKSISIVVFVLLVSMPIATISAFEECSCKFGSQGTPVNGLNEMDVIFVGEVVAIEESRTAEGLLDVTFQVSKHYKGHRDTSVIVCTPKDLSHCGYSFKNGETYLVYAKYRDKVLLTDICTRTRTISQANGDGDIVNLNLHVYGNQAGTEADTEIQELGKLDPRLKDAVKADAVFIGDVVAIEQPKDAPEMIDVKFSVHKSYTVGKSLDPIVVVRTPKDIRSSGCDFASGIGKEYLVYANYSDGVLYTDRKSRTKDNLRAALDGDIELLDSLADGMQAYGKDINEIFPGNKIDRDKLPSADVLWNNIKALVLSKYPNAKITITKDHLTFEYHTRYFVLGDVTKIGPGSYKKIIKGPKEDGILGDISLVYDKFYNYYVNAGWASYKSSPEGAGGIGNFGQVFISVKEKGSKKYSCYIHLTLTTPNGTGAGFEDPLAKLIDNFESYLQDNKNTITPVK